MKNIKLGYDKDGNYLVDFAGLIYLIQEGCIVEGACVYMTESSGNISEYILIRDTEAALSAIRSFQNRLRFNPIKTTKANAIAIRSFQNRLRFNII